MRKKSLAIARKVNHELEWAHLVAGLKNELDAERLARCKRLGSSQILNEDLVLRVSGLEREISRQELRRVDKYVAHGDAPGEGADRDPKCIVPLDLSLRVEIDIVDTGESRSLLSDAENIGRENDPGMNPLAAVGYIR